MEKEKVEALSNKVMEFEDLDLRLEELVSLSMVFDEAFTEGVNTLEAYREGYNLFNRLLSQLYCEHHNLMKEFFQVAHDMKEGAAA